MTINIHKEHGNTLKQTMVKLTTTVQMLPVSFRFL